MGRYLFALCTIYLCQTCYQLLFINKEDFNYDWDGEPIDQPDEFYQYSVDMDRAKVLHALSLECITFYLVFTSAQFKSLTAKGYCNFIWMISILTTIFILPIFFFSWKMYSDSVRHTALGREGT